MTNLADQLTDQRWFGSKTREVSHADVVEEVALGDDLRISFVEATFGAGTHETYQLLRDAGDGDVLAEHALELLDRIADDADVAGGDSIVRFRSIADVDATLLPRPMGAEQSNSSIVFGDELALKVYRRVEPGINPELEIARFLSDHGFAHVPPLLGWYEVEGLAIDATLGLLQGYVAGGRDGWELAREEILTAPDRFIERLGRLGEVIGELHAVLGSDATDPAFAPEEPSQEAIGLLTATIDEEVERLFLGLGDGLATAEIRGRGEEIRDRLRALTQVAVGGRVIRHHGDLHLGQTLYTGDDWVVLDFEGEPGRPLAERRRKRSPLRDVAGMLRSFAYAASAAEIQGGVAAPADWEQRARDTFLEGYLRTVDETLLPPGQAATEQMLSIFELERAIYELRYELNNRPDWVRIPIAGIQRLLDGEG
ncbi:MAG TPA: phosphotransferase [Solirubrobacteraceae bacterium]|nr:phosphotransferase [Solirubrobacteraceae bacterium]